MYQKTRVITFSCGIKNSAVCSFVTSTKHPCNIQADGHTDRQKYYRLDHASIAALRGKNRYQCEKVEGNSR